ncbi:hypothetical protein PMIN06_002058 [Paraphaeosphaeria minitans]
MCCCLQLPMDLRHHATFRIMPPRRCVRVTRNEDGLLDGFLQAWRSSNLMLAASPARATQPLGSLSTDSTDLSSTHDGQCTEQDTTIHASSSDLTMEIGTGTLVQVELWCRGWVQKLR